MVESQDPTVQRRRLTSELRRLRASTGLSQRDVAEELAWSPSKLLRIENGTVGISKTDLLALLAHYGVTERRQVDSLTRLALGAKRQATTPYRDVLSNELIAFYNSRAAAVRIRQFEPLTVPELLQTEDYAREILRANGHLYDDPAYNEKRVDAQMDQVALLEKADGPEFFFIIDEAVLRRWVGGSGVIRRQLEELKRMAAIPRVTIQILRFQLGAYRGMRGPIQILEFAEGEDYVLYLASWKDGPVAREVPEEVERYLETFWDLEGVATKPSEINDVVDSILREIDILAPEASIS